MRGVKIDRFHEVGAKPYATARQLRRMDAKAARKAALKEAAEREAHARALLAEAVSTQETR